MKTNKKHLLNPYVLVILSFILVILVGSFLLTMPWTQKNGQWANYVDALVTAVSATCVTGIATYIDGVADTISFGGQVVIITMVQIGGLGFVTILTFIVTIFKSKLQFKDRYLLSQMVNSTNFADVVKFVRKIMLISFICEFAGAILYFPAFYIMYHGDVGATIWNSIFHSISSFNNAGFDLFEGTTSFIRGETGLLSYLNEGMYIYFQCVAMALVIAGGISFLVILDVFNFKKSPRQWRAFTKIVLITNFVLLVAGTLLLYLTDGFKGEKPMNLLECLFESVSSRTAGFATYGQDNISIAGKAITCFLMLIGGSPLSTAGGIKTTTLFMIVLAIISYFRAKKVHAFKRSFSMTMVVKALTLVILSITVILVSYLVIVNIGLDPQYRIEDITFDGNPIRSSLNEQAIFDVFSCFGTVGFFGGLEPYYPTATKLILCVLMFLGRLGPITFFQVFQKNMDKEETTHYQYVEEDVLIG